MIPILCGPLGNPLIQLLQADEVPFGPYRFVAAALRPRVSIEIVDRELPAPFVAHPGGRVVLTSHLVDTLAAYARAPRHDYLRMMAVCGVVQARVFQRNPLLRSEDLYHHEPTRCLFARRYMIEEYFQPLESPQLCAGCRRFYRELLPRREFFGLKEAINVVARHTHATAQRSQ